MTKTKTFKKTERQIEAINLLGRNCRNFMLYGGSRSGKTFIIIYSMVIRASRVKSRHAILRLNFNHAKRAIWLDTLPKVMELCFPDLPYDPNSSDYFITLPNGSEIWVGGLDEKKRVEKILGQEYSTMFFNECSQIPKESISTALTRLAEKNNLKNKAFYDENPPSKRHWSYWQFIRHFDPKDQRELDPKKYVSMLMNPGDNLENIDEDYLTEILDELPERERRRFRDGEFLEGEEGAIYYAFNEDEHIIECEYDPRYPIWTGHDFNVSPMTAVIGQVKKGVLHIFDEIFLKQSDYQAQARARKLTATDLVCLKIKEKYPGAQINAVPDSTGKKQTTNANKSDIEIMRKYFNVKPGHNPFRVDRYAAVNASLGKSLVVISPKCPFTINDLNSVVYKQGTDKPCVIDPMLGHISDSLGYLIFRTVNPLRAQASSIQVF